MSFGEVRTRGELHARSDGPGEGSGGGGRQDEQRPEVGVGPQVEECAACLQKGKGMGEECELEMTRESIRGEAGRGRTSSGAMILLSLEHDVRSL